MALPNPSREYTLRLHPPCGRTLGLALILFALLIGLGEAVVRTHAFRVRVVADSRGGRHGQFGTQLGRLETVVARDGPVDCIILGNSMVWFGFDPEAFARAYQRQTGRDIRCFNFGLVAMPTVAAGTLAPILVDDFEPSLLIYGTSAQDFALSSETEDARVLLDMPWLRNRLGEFTVEGWLYDHSRLYQLWSTLGRLLRLKDRWLLLTGWYGSARWNYGFEAHDEVYRSISTPPDPQSEETADEYLFGLLSEYEMLPENLAGLEQVMAQKGPNTQVLVVEMPRPHTSLAFFGNGQQDQQRFLDQVAGMAESRVVPFWQTTQLGLIPDDGWWDYSHLNAKGAFIFSDWLGEQVGDAVIQGTLKVPIDGHWQSR